MSTGMLPEDVRLVLKDEATRTMVASHIGSMGFSLHMEQLQDEENWIPYETVYTQGNQETSIHYVEDFVYGENYLLLQGPESAELAERLGQGLPVYSRTELFAAADKAANGPDYLKAVTNLIVGAPAVFDEEFFVRMEKALKHSEPDIRYAVIERTGYLEWMDVASVLGNLALTDENEKVRLAAKSMSEQLQSAFLERVRVGDDPWLERGDVRLVLKNLGENPMETVRSELTIAGFRPYAMVERDEELGIPAEVIYSTPDKTTLIHCVENMACHVNYVLVRGSEAAAVGEKLRGALAVYADMDLLSAVSTAKTGERMIAAITCLAVGAPTEYEESWFIVIKKALTFPEAAVRRIIVKRLDFISWSELFPLLQEVAHEDADESVRAAAEQLLEQYE